MIDTYGVVIDFANTHRTGLARRGMAEWETVDLANPTEEHRMLREMVRDFVREEVEPQALEFDREEKFNLDLFRKLGEYGLLGISVPAEYGLSLIHI